jgi:hypothetical protein
MTITTQTERDMNISVKMMGNEVKINTTQMIC